MAGPSLPPEAPRRMPAAWFVPGVLLGLALAGLLLRMGLSSGSYLGALYLFLFVAVPLGLGWLLLGVLPLVWAGKRATRAVWLCMLAPPLLAIPGTVALSSIREQWFIQRLAEHERAFPAASEIHINLSGHNLMPDGQGLSNSQHAMPADAPERFLQGVRRRYLELPSPVPDEGYEALYEVQAATAWGVRPLRLKAAQMRRWRLHLPPDGGDGLPAEEPPPTGEWAPLRVVQPPPELSGPPALVDGTDRRIHWLYIHYAQHTEVAPVIALSSQSHDLHRIHLLNGGPDAIVRWQVNGQELLVSHRHASQPGDCDSDTGGYLRVPAPDTQPQTWQLRWQTLAAPGQWQEAEVPVPAWPQAQASDLPAPAEQAVALHRLPDGRWLAQRLRRQGQGHAQQVQATALPEPVACRHAGSS